MKDAAEEKRSDERFRRCSPLGMPRLMSGMTAPLLTTQSPGRMTRYRDGSPVRRTRLDGRGLPKSADREDFYNANSIGHYKGRTSSPGVSGFPCDSGGMSH